MKRQFWESTIATQEALIRTEQRCCRAFAELGYRPLGTDDDFVIDERLEVAEVGGVAGPALAFALPAESNGKRLRFETYSDRRRGFAYLPKMLFIRPNVAFLDEGFRAIETISDPLLCNGGRKGGFMNWADFSVPESAVYVVLVPSIQQPVQWVDTRLIGGGGQYMAPLAGAIAESISEQRKSYMSPTYMGLTGLVSVRVVANGEPAPGRCLNEPPTEESFA